jgi:hypothetical protein
MPRLTEVLEVAVGFTVAVLRVFTVAGASRVFMAVTIFSAVVVFLVRVSVSMATGTRGGIGIIPIYPYPYDYDAYYGNRYYGNPYYGNGYPR